MLSVKMIQTLAKGKRFRVKSHNVARSFKMNLKNEYEILTRETM
jgi:hypothetical protein